jgi:UDP-N-acetylmuramate dehydrogenase
VREGIPFRILGGGSNILVSDGGVGEVVVSTRRLSRIYRPEGDAPVLRIEAGTSLGRLVSACHLFGYRGAEPLVGIPGTVGGAAITNAGGRYGCMGDLIREATVMNPSGELESLALSPGAFSYRRSPLKGRVVVDVAVRLERGDKKRIWETMSAYLKEKKAAQPLLERSCGCIFKNPSWTSAGRLLDGVGMKGRSRGGAWVSPKHANFILNRSSCRFEDYLGLIHEGRERVREKYGVDLELEIETWPG